MAARARGAGFGHIVSSLWVLLRAEREWGLSITEFLSETGTSSAIFYTTAREALTTYGSAEIETELREGAVRVKLTEKGRKLAECLEPPGAEVGWFLIVAGFLCELG